ncbi:MAG: threonine/serine exporter family protein [Parasporobacterium sp.]|nr:threonine/serine exporter family protein [Parasporobacterium sp.]
MIKEVIFSAIGTAAFALIFGVDKKHYIYCAAAGGAGYAVYAVLYYTHAAGDAVSILAGTVMVSILSRIFAVVLKVPTTIFMTTGIFPLVPGVRLFWTVYYLIVNIPQQAGAYGLSALKAAGAIVLGIVLIFHIPHKIFSVFAKKTKEPQA